MIKLCYEAIFLFITHNKKPKSKIIFILVEDKKDM